MNKYEMYGPSGNRACQRMVDRISAKILSKEGISDSDLVAMTRGELDYIALHRSEVYDKEPKYHIAMALNVVLKEADYPFRFDPELNLVKTPESIS